MNRNLELLIKMEILKSMELPKNMEILRRIVFWIKMVILIKTRLFKIRKKGKRWVITVILRTGSV